MPYGTTKSQEATGILFACEFRDIHEGRRILGDELGFRLKPMAPVIGKEGKMVGHSYFAILPCKLDDLRKYTDNFPEKLPVACLLYSTVGGEYPSIPHGEDPLPWGFILEDGRMFYCNGDSEAVKKYHSAVSGVKAIRDRHPGEQEKMFE